jgi:hypothetical protein
MYIKVVVACAANGNGQPDFFGTVITCTQADYESGIHYDLAKAQALEDGYEEPMIAFDENDGPDWLFEQVACILS